MHIVCVCVYVIYNFICTHTLMGSAELPISLIRVLEAKILQYSCVNNYCQLVLFLISTSYEIVKSKSKTKTNKQN